MKKLLLICFLLGCVSADAWAQVPAGKREKFPIKGIGFRLGYGYQRAHYLELGMFRYYTDKGSIHNGTILGFKSWGGGGEIELNRQPNYSLKIYTEFLAIFLGARLNLSYTRNEHSSGILLTPEFGLNLLGLPYCYLGYAIPLYKIGSDRFYGFRLSVGFILTDNNLGMRDFRTY